MEASGLRPVSTLSCLVLLSYAHSMTVVMPPGLLFCRGALNTLIVLYCIVSVFLYTHKSLHVVSWTVTDVRPSPDIYRRNAGVPWLRSYFRLAQEHLRGQNEKRPHMVWIGHPAIVYSILKWF